MIGIKVSGGDAKRVLSHIPDPIHSPHCVAMCSRLSIFDPNLEVSLASQHGIHPDRWRGKAQYEPKYSVRCEKSAPVLMMDRTNPKEPNLILEQMRWGMRRKDFNDKTNTVDIFTAKATRLVDPSKAWGGIRQVQRCIVPCDG